ncbi:hypothetical protein ABPG75_012547 [Micractinium tetrahymenae]
MAAAKPATGLDVRLEGSSLLVGATVVLEQLAGEASMRQDESGAGAVLGFAAPGGTPTARADFALGKLRASRFLALGRTSLWWCTPAWGTSAEQVPEETQFLLLELGGGKGGYALMLPLIDSGAFRATLRGSSEDGTLGLRIESGAADVSTGSWRSALLVAAGNDPFELVDRAVAAAARLSGTSKPRSEKEVPGSADVFGWCTWDAFYSKVSAAGVEEGLKSLVDGGAPPRFVIIDDGWQRTDVDPQHREAAAAGCLHSDSALGMGSTVHEVEEAAAAMLSGPDNHMDANLEAVHKIAQDAKKDAAQDGSSAAAAQQPEQPPSSGGARRLLELPAAWAQAARRSVGNLAARLQAAFFDYCRQLLEATPANHWRMRLFSALATSRVVRPALLSFYAAASDHTRRLVSVRANTKFSSPSAGPQHALNSEGEDLAGVVAALKARHGLKYVYAWHAMGGFWGGLGLEDPDMAKYKPQLVLPTPTPGMLSVDPTVAWVQPVLSGVGLPADPRQLHEDMHSYLAGCGIDGVKVDVQSTVGLLGSGAGRGGGPALAAAYHSSLEASARRHFPGNHLINCMCHSTEDLYRMEDTNLARVSDDFYPTWPESHLAHIANCAFNTLFFGALVIPDWDMFHSLHEKALLHATARAVSGGPIYVSDRPGRHDFELLRRLVLPDGSVLRCRLPGRPTADCLFADVSRDGTTALKVWNANAFNAIVACFNIQGSAFERSLRRFSTHDSSPPALAAAVRPSDAPVLAGAAEMFAAYQDSTKELRLLGAADCLEVRLAGGGGSDVVTLSPVTEAGGVLFAPIGLTDMLNAGGAVLSCAVSGGHSDDGYDVQPARAALKLRGAGTVLCYCSHAPTGVAVGGQQVPFSYDAERSALTFELVPADGRAAGKAVDCAVQF